jgi:hypothetical protein
MDSLNLTADLVMLQVQQVHILVRLTMMFTLGLLMEQWLLMLLMLQLVMKALELCSHI